MSYEYMQGMGSINITAEDIQRFNEQWQTPQSVTVEPTGWLQNLVGNIADIGSSITPSTVQQQRIPRCQPGWWKKTISRYDTIRHGSAGDDGCKAVGTSPGTGRQPDNIVYCCPPRPGVTDRPEHHMAFLEAQLEQQQAAAQVPVVEPPIEPAPPVMIDGGPPEPPVTNGAVTNGNGNGVVVVSEEKKYFGFTAQQLMLMGAGGVVLYMLLK